MTGAHFGPRGNRICAKHGSGVKGDFAASPLAKVAHYDNDFIDIVKTRCGKKQRAASGVGDFAKSSAEGRDL